MARLLTDTHPEAEKVQVSLIRGASIAQRLGRTRSLSRTVINLSRRAMVRANPEMNERELAVLFVAHHYGEDLAVRLQAHLTRDGK